MLKVEFHCHTLYSEDSLTRPKELVEACQKKRIDRVIVTDHNAIQGALEAKRLDPERVIVGEEILTTVGELLAAFVIEEIPQGLTPLEAIQRLKDQGAFISVSHPFDRMRSPWGEAGLLEILPHIDAIETFNARCLWPGFNWNAQAFARRHALPGTSGSDAHIVSELGAATLLLENFADADDLRKAMRKARPQNSLSAPWVHFASWKASRNKRQQISSNKI
jgi:predicted metal-dependent phosphoesterase TrpH